MTYNYLWQWSTHCIPSSGIYWDSTSATPDELPELGVSDEWDTCFGTKRARRTVFGGKFTNPVSLRDSLFDMSESLVLI
jgi:hypothetical protein